MRIGSMIRGWQRRHQVRIAANNTGNFARLYEENQATLEGLKNELGKKGRTFDRLRRESVRELEYALREAVGWGPIRVINGLNTGEGYQRATDEENLLRLAKGLLKSTPVRFIAVGPRRYVVVVISFDGGGNACYRVEARQLEGMGERRLRELADWAKVSIAHLAGVPESEIGVTFIH